ncbi:polyphosphate polymerase domain-containing protein [Aeoliella sp. SH292]|uniref:polyphosphate polymerase domain-containing protein n=1 Tax=Aeoliella sp. SH292 TaxID=3454464 RepID=UPI003F9BD383
MSEEPLNLSQMIDLQLAKMTPISLDEMDAVKLMDRVDTKYLSDARHLPLLLTELADQYRVLEVGGFRRAAYTTLYFDTAGRDCYLAHHNGRSNRFKFRQRYYATSNISFFEVKQKTNRGRTIKKRVPIEAITQQLTDEAESLVLALDRRAPKLLPQMWTHFSRITLVGLAGIERVTIDLDLRFEAGDQLRQVPGAMIVEVKQARATRQSPIRQWLRKSHVSPMRVSKYCVGSAMLDPTLKRNRFKRKLRALESKVGEVAI